MKVPKIGRQRSRQAKRLARTAAEPAEPPRGCGRTWGPGLRPNRQGLSPLQLCRPRTDRYWRGCGIPAQRCERRRPDVRSSYEQREVVRGRLTLLADSHAPHRLRNGADLIRIPTGHEPLACACDSRLIWCLPSQSSASYMRHPSATFPSPHSARRADSMARMDPAPLPQITPPRRVLRGFLGITAGSTFAQTSGLGRSPAAVAAVYPVGNRPLRAPPGHWCGARFILKFAA